jgi:hypothetical protein
MDQTELLTVFAAAALAELDKMEQRRIQVSSPREILKDLFKNIRDPKPAEENIIPASPLPVIRPEFPRLLASYGEKTLQYAIVENYAEWHPLHHWFTVFPPQQPATKAVTTTLEAELEKLKTEGATERPAQEHERRRATKGYPE